jgi:hypothetical protein
MSDGKKYEPKPPKKTRWKKGQSGNPAGRKKRDALIDEFLESVVGAKDSRERRLALLERMFTSAMNPSRKDHAKLLEMWVHLYWGKPRERIEMSGPGGKPIESADVTPRRRPTTGEMRKRIEILKAKMFAHEAGQKTPERASPAPEEPDAPEG